MLTLPVVAFVLFHLPYSVYHVPAVYDLSLQYLPVHIAAQGNTALSYSVPAAFACASTMIVFT